MEIMEKIIYNLIVLLYDQISDQYTGMDDPNFRAYVIAETGIEPAQYDAVMSSKENEEPFITEQDVDDIMCTALEGGITYWCSSARVVGGDYLGEYASDQISRGGGLILYVYEPYEDDEAGNEIDQYTLDRAKFDKGFEKYLAEYGRKSVTDEDGKFDPCQVDGDIADKIVQYALFGDIIYG